MAKSLPSNGALRQALALTPNIKLVWKGLPGTNTLAYYEKAQLTPVKSFIKSAPLVSCKTNYFSILKLFQWHKASLTKNQVKKLVIHFVKLDPDLLFRISPKNIYLLFKKLSLSCSNFFWPFHNFATSFFKTHSTIIKSRKLVKVYRGCIFSHERPCYEGAVSDLDPKRSMHKPVQVAHSLFIEGSHTTKNTASRLIKFL